MTIQLEPDILECKLKWVLENITTNKARRGDGIPDELFQILKDDAVKVLHSVCQQIWKTQQWPQDRKRSVFIPIPKKGNAKECSNYRTIALISHASKVVFKVLQTRLHQYVNRKFLGAGFLQYSASPSCGHCSPAHPRRTRARGVGLGVFLWSHTKECSNYCTIALISHASKVMLKILHLWWIHFDI